MKHHYEFLRSGGPVALYGLSRRRKGFAFEVLRAFRSGQSRAMIYAVHPNAGGREMHGLRSVPSAKKIEPTPDLVVIVLKPEAARKAIEDAADAGVRKAWLAMNACSRANREYAESRGMQVVGGCPMLFVEKPGFPHNIHRALAKLFGKV